MPFVRQNHINSVRPLFVTRPTIVCHWANRLHTSTDTRATLLPNHPELNDQTASDRILNQYHNQCATLGVGRSTRLQDICVRRPQLEHFVRLRSDATAALVLKHGSSTKLFKQYKECEDWLRRNAPKVNFAYEAERKAVLEQYPKLAIAVVREGILKQYEIESERILVPRSAEEGADQPREFVAGILHSEKRQFCELALHYVAIHLIDNPITTEDALEKWKADYQRCQDTLAKVSLIPYKEEKSEALEKYPDLKDLDACRTTISEYNKLLDVLAEKEKQGTKLSAKDFEGILSSGLKSIAAQAFLPGADQVERRKKRQEHREYFLSELEVSQAKEKKLRLWFILDITWLGEFVGLI
ncbi:unnamed protein product [Aureobasidium mustum]|uniref:Uncharacterized protein n=1 Tax=Aureobasidium mustum TaxID=2773714 RepID=A0A9N8KCX3_9PEZI|nr:unnamed protein product [Aureobasidium mustum]